VAADEAAPNAGMAAAEVAVAATAAADVAVAAAAEVAVAADVAWSTDHQAAMAAAMSGKGDGGSLRGPDVLALDQECGEIAVSPLGDMKLEPAPYCTKCGYTVDPITPGVRVVRKTPPAFQCNKCNSKTVMLTRMFGRWPPDEFKTLPPDVLKEFWATECVDKDGLKKAVENILVSRYVESQIAENAGPFLPLKTWADAPYHFDTAEIEAKAPMRVHAILGKTYQVKIVTTGEKKVRDTVREQMAKMLSNASASSSKAKPGPAEVSEVAEQSDDDDSVCEDDGDSDGSPSSSSDSSSSSGKKHKKKHKKGTKPHKRSKRNKRGEKDKRKLKKQAADEAKRKRQNEMDHKKEKARITKVKNLASKALAKTTSLTMELGTLLKDKDCTMVPSMMLTKVADLQAALQDYEKEAKDKIKAKVPLDLTFSPDELAATCKEATNHKIVLTNMLETVRKMR